MPYLYICAQSQGERCAEEAAAGQPAARQRRHHQQGPGHGLISSCVLWESFVTKVFIYTL